MFELALAAAVVAVALSLGDLRKGFYVCLLAGFIQDPLRKLVPDQPVYLVTLVAALFGVTFAGAAVRGLKVFSGGVSSWLAALRPALRVFVGVVLVQAIATVVRTGSVALGGIGLMAYLAPLPAVVLGYHFARDERAIFRILAVYAAMSALMLSGVYLSYLGVDWPVLRPIGWGLVVYSSTAAVHLPAGLMRSPEIAAWHAGAAVCFLIVLGVSRRWSSPRVWLGGSLILFFTGAILLTGRRKTLAEVVLFVALYMALLFRFKSKTSRVGWVVLAAGVATALVAPWVFPAYESRPDFRYLLERGASTGGDAAARVMSTIDALRWVVAYNGILGGGAGTGSQGGQHFGADPGVGMAAESGPGKVLAELGAPGLAALIWLSIRLCRFLWGVMGRVRAKDPERFVLTCGLVAFLFANGAVFFTAHQVFGDPFVLLILGWIVGFAVATQDMRPEPEGATRQLAESEWLGLVAREGVAPLGRL